MMMINDHHHDDNHDVLNPICVSSSVLLLCESSPGNYIVAHSRLDGHRIVVSGENILVNCDDDDDDDNDDDDDDDDWGFKRTNAERTFF